MHTPSIQAVRQGFTLIELLIVVAIIAILAAIAVPNFLEAQTRSKIARVVSDMRTISTALESYAVDNRKYPFDIDSRGWPWYLTDVVTTPIAYLTNGSMMQDPFRKPMDTGAAEGQRFRYVNYASTISPGWGTSPYPVTPYVSRTRPGWAPHHPESTVGPWMAVFGAWKLSSAGPDATANVTGFLGVDLVYDPSNGTVSDGDIIRSQRQANH